MIAPCPSRADKVTHGFHAVRSCIAFGSVLSFHASAQNKVATAFSSQISGRMLRNKLDSSRHRHRPKPPPPGSSPAFARRGWATAPAR